MMKIVECVRDRAGEEPFLLGEKKYQFVTALYPDGKEDIGVYVFGNDMVLDYEYWMDQNFISYEKGGITERELEAIDSSRKVGRDYAPDYDKLMVLLRKTGEFISSDLSQYKRGSNPVRVYYEDDFLNFEQIGGNISSGYSRSSIKKVKAFAGEREILRTFQKANSHPIETKKQVEQRSKGAISVEIYVFNGGYKHLTYVFNKESFKKGGSIEDLEKKNPTLKASREHEKRDKDFEIFEVSVEADAMMEAEGAEALEAIEIPAMAEIGADGAEAAFERGGEVGEFPFEFKGFKYNVEDTGGMVDDYGRKVWQVSVQDKDGDVETMTTKGARDTSAHQEAKDFIKNELLPYYGLDEAKNDNKLEKGGAIEYDWKKAPSTYTKLPYKLAKYFKRPKGSIRVSIDKLTPTSMVQAEVERAYEKMKGAFLGEIEPRKPISLRKKRSKTGKVTYDILDGNSTYANAYLSGWTHMIGEVVEEVKEGKVPSLLEYARSIRKEGESWASARDRAKKTYDAKKFKDGGDIEVFIVNEGVKFDKEKYPSIFGDSDADKLPNVDDPNPTQAGDKKSIEQVKLSDVFERLLNVKEGLDVRMDKVVDSMKKKSPEGSKIYARTKTPYSIVNKLVNKRLGTLTDMIGTTIEVEDQRGLESLRDRVERGEFGQVLDFDNYYDSPKAGYRAYHFIVDAEGVPTEIQLKTRRQKELNKLSHEPYKKEKLNAKRLDELSLLARKADEGDAQAIEDFEMLMKYPKAVEKQLTLP